MSEARNEFGRKSLTPKTKKLHPRVDLTAMVSVSFLLIVFFMLTSFLARNNAMELGMPDKEDEIDHSTHCYWGLTDNRTMTLLLGNDNKIVSYFGDFNAPLEGPNKFSYNNNDLTKELLFKNEMLQKLNGDKSGLIVIIKSSKQSTYGNLVNVLDKLAIARTPTYAVVDITPEEEALLASK
ncbi:ExbD/TolR family protein [Flavobacterium sp. GCM10027622]|uniref:ExbD/TolR family protein n=1 Tax=unclassified Flavobacterium TaxID=196869 RepID=UPI00360F797C